MRWMNASASFRKMYQKKVFKCLDDFLKEFYAIYFPSNIQNCKMTSKIT